MDNLLNMNTYILSNENELSSNIEQFIFSIDNLKVIYFQKTITHHQLCDILNNYNIKYKIGVYNFYEIILFKSNIKY